MTRNSLPLISLLALAATASPAYAQKAAKQAETPAYDASVPKPTLSEVRYGDHERQVLDFWKAEAERPTPVAFVIHSPYAMVSGDDPPVYLKYSAPPALGQEQKDPTHTSNFGVKLREHCAATGVDCELVHPGVSGMKHATPTAYLIEKLKTGR